MSTAFLRKFFVAALGCGLSVAAFAADNIEWVSINLPASGSAGPALQFSAVVKNTGDTTWDGNCYLELADSAGNHLYYPSVAGVAPGQTVSRMFVLNLPNTSTSVPMTYTFKGLRHNVAYFGPPQSRTINVQPGPVNQGVILTGTQEAGGIYLLDPAAMPTISTADTLSVPFRLRAKVIDGTQYGWHLANVPDTNPFVLDNPMTVPGSYPVTSLYWIKYDPQWGTLMEIGQERFVPVRAPGGVVALSSYAFGRNASPTIYTTEPFTATYWLYAKFKNASGQEWDAMPRPANAAVNSNNNYYTLDPQLLPPPGDYSLEMTWKRFDAAGNVVGIGPTFAKPLVVIYPSGGQVLSASDNIEWESDGNGGGDYTVREHTFEVGINGTVEITVSGSFAITTAVDRLNANDEREWVAGGSANFTFGVSAGQRFILRVGSSGGSGTYQATGVLTTTLSAPSFATSTLVVNAVVNTPMSLFVGATGSGTVVHSVAPGTGPLPPGLNLSSEGYIYGTPTSVGAATATVRAVNSVGQALRELTFATPALAQTIFFGNLDAKYTNSLPFTLSATTTSGLPVSFTVISGPATINGATVTLTGFAGSVIIRASQNGSPIYAPAAPVDRAFLVSVYSVDAELRRVAASAVNAPVDNVTISTTLPRSGFAYIETSSVVRPNEPILLRVSEGDMPEALADGHLRNSAYIYTIVPVDNPNLGSYANFSSANRPITDSIQVTRSQVGMYSLSAFAARFSSGNVVLRELGTFPVRVANSTPAAPDPQLSARKTYYISSSSGNNTFSGLSESQAWETFAPINSYVAAGDTILLKRGDTWNLNEELILTAEGTANQPITIGAYGSGAKPKLRRFQTPEGVNPETAADYPYPYATILSNPAACLKIITNHIKVENIEFRNSLWGIHIDGKTNIVVRNCDFYNMNRLKPPPAPGASDVDRKMIGIGILVDNSKDSSIIDCNFVRCFEGLLIQQSENITASRCITVDNGCFGIAVKPVEIEGVVKRSSHVFIDSCQINNTGKNVGEIYHPGAAGVYLDGVKNVVLSRTTINGVSHFGNQTDGMAVCLETGPSNEPTQGLPRAVENVVIVDNVLGNSQGPAFSILGGTGAKNTWLVNNGCSNNNTSSSIWLEGNNSGASWGANSLNLTHAQADTTFTSFLPLNGGDQDVHFVDNFRANTHSNNAGIFSEVYYFNNVPHGFRFSGGANNVIVIGQGL